MVVARTNDGFEVEIDKRILSDWRFTMLIAKIQSGTDAEKISSAEKLVNLLLGEDKRDALFAHIAEKNDGFVPIEDVMTAIADIMNSCNETKN